MFDSRDRITEWVDALGQSVRCDPDPKGNITGITDRRGNTTENWYHTVLGLPTMTKDALGNEIYYHYKGKFKFYSGFTA